MGYLFFWALQEIHFMKGVLNKTYGVNQKHYYG